MVLQVTCHDAKVCEENLCFISDIGVNMTLPRTPGLPTLGRRTLLGGSVAGLALLAGCSNNDGSTGGNDDRSGEVETAGALPNHVPYTELQPDLPAGDAGVPAGYFSYPQEPVEFGQLPLPQTDPAQMLAQSLPQHVPQATNSWYQALTADMGNQFNLIAGGYTEYEQKFAVTIASGDLPDMMMIGSPPRTDQVLESSCKDLTPFLAGDAVEQYPALAAIPPETWEVAILNGKLWGISKGNPPAGHVWNVRTDHAEEAGLGATPAPADGAELMDMLRALSAPDQNRFAIGGDPVSWMVPNFLMMHGVKPGWSRADDGTFHHQYEDEALEQVVADVKTLFDERVIHPNSIIDPSNNGSWWVSGTTSCLIQGFSGWSTYVQRGVPAGYIDLPQWGGGGAAATWGGNAGYAAYMAISAKASDERVHEILSLWNYIAAPFGTKEYLTVNYGVEGTHWEWVDGHPTRLSDAYEAERVGGYKYAGSTDAAQLYTPGDEELVRTQHAYLSEKLPVAVYSDAKGLYSTSEQEAGAAANRELLGVMREIIQSQRPVSDLAGAVESWKKDAGDEIREEYQEAWAAANG